jgi:hypothetical protein
MLPVRNMVEIFFERVLHGHNSKGADLLATKIQDVLIPDFDFLFLETWELNEKYGWKNVSVANFVRDIATKPRAYVLDTVTKEVKPVQRHS